MGSMVNGKDPREESMNKRELVWPDRLGIGIAFLGGLFTIVYLAFLEWSSDGGWADLRLSLIAFFGVEALLALPVWLVARTLDFVIGGPQNGERRPKMWSFVRASIIPA
jgi:hypothetical protein